MLFYTLMILTTLYFIQNIPKEKKEKLRAYCPSFLSKYIKKDKRDKDRDRDSEEDMHYLRWNYREVKLDVAMEVYSIDFLGYHFRVTMTSEQAGDGKYYVSFFRDFKKGNHHGMDVFDGKKLTPITVVFTEKSKAKEFMIELKREISGRMMEDSLFKSFSEDNLIAVM